MTYLIIRRWDENFHPTSINRKEDLSEAIALADKVGGFHQEVDFANKQTRFMVVDPVHKTVSYNQAAAQADEIAQQWVEVRAKRNQLLADSDWRAMSDLTLSDAWTTYRQALRDVGGQADPSNITWPDAPA